MTDTPAKPLTADEIAAMKAADMPMFTREEGQRLIATIEQQAEQIERLRGALTRARRQIDPLALGTFAAVDEALAATEPVNDKR